MIAGHEDSLAMLPTSRRAFFFALAVALAAMNVAAQTAPLDSAREQVLAAERAFARSMAERDFAAFGRHIADDAIFFNGRQALRGKAAVLAAWRGFFDGSAAPFSWEPDQVEVLDSGDLALSTGPVKNPRGEVVARFNSIWRRQADGGWLVVFDKGSPPDPTAK
jgi:ketosteroid isomerase-like protein